MNEYQPKTGGRCYCKKGIMRDNCPECEGTGWLIDFKKIRANGIVETIKRLHQEKKGG